MNSFAAFVLFAVLAATNASLIAPLTYSAIPTGTILQGPSSRTTAIGPDGSSISSVAPGGTIVSEHGNTIISQGAPAAIITPSAGIAYAAAPGLAVPAISTYSAALVPQVLTYGAVPAVPSWGGIAAENTVVAGPSGVISQNKAINGARLALW